MVEYVLGTNCSQCGLTLGEQAWWKEDIGFVCTECNNGT